MCLRIIWRGLNFDARRTTPVVRTYRQPPQTPPCTVDPLDDGQINGRLRSQNLGEIDNLFVESASQVTGIYKLVPTHCQVSIIQSSVLLTGLI